MIKPPQLFSILLCALFTSLAVQSAENADSSESKVTQHAEPIYINEPRELISVEEANARILRERGEPTASAPVLADDSNDYLEEAAPESRANATIELPISDWYCNDAMSEIGPTEITLIIPEVWAFLDSDAAWLPPEPKNPNATLMGVDSDEDCVRDDIERWIASMYPDTSDYKKRLYLYLYTIWLKKALETEYEIDIGIASYLQYASAECFRRIATEQESEEMLRSLFAKYHNTKSRTYRYIDQHQRIAGQDSNTGDFTFTCP